MRAVVQWFRSAAIVGGLCALPSGPAVPSPVLEAGSANRPALALASVGISTPTLRHVNFVEASAPITLSSLRYGVRDATPAPPLARTETVAANLGHGSRQPSDAAADGSTALDDNSMLALMLAALGMAALAAARAPAERAASATTVPNEPARP